MKNNTSQFTAQSTEDKVETNHSMIIEEEKNTEKEIGITEQKIGVVCDCLRLNIRKVPKPDSEVVCEIDQFTEVMIIDDESSDDFYKICTPVGVEGFCMKKYISVRT